MRKSRFTDEKMVSILRETDRDSVAAVAKRHGISEQTIYGWKKRFGQEAQAVTQAPLLGCHVVPLRRQDVHGLS